MKLSLILALTWLHFVSDFILQNDTMAQRKSTSNYWLGVHVTAYSVPFLIFGWRYALLNGALHFVTDYFSSRATSKLWKKGARHWFFVVIGLDQAVHFTCLAYTASLLGIWK